MAFAMFVFESYRQDQWLPPKHFVVLFAYWCLAGLALGIFESVRRVPKHPPDRHGPRCHDCGELSPAHTAWCPMHRGMPLRLSRS
jgi:hypothetical protein